MSNHPTEYSFSFSNLGAVPLISGWFGSWAKCLSVYTVIRGTLWNCLWVSLWPLWESGVLPPMPHCRCGLLWFLLKNTVRWWPAVVLLWTGQLRWPPLLYFFCRYPWNGTAQHIIFFYARSHLSAPKHLKSIHSPNISFIFTLDYPVTQLSL